MEKYETVKELNKGAYGIAYLVNRKQDNKKFVMKNILLTKDDENNNEFARNEAKTLSEIHHSNIIKYEEHFEADGNLYIVMEYADGGNLDDLVKKYKSNKTRKGPGLSNLTENEIMRYFSQICCAVAYLHSKHIIHRDIKCENVFLMSDGTIKLGDFGVCKLLDCTVGMASTVVGTPHYLPPELYKSAIYNNKCDVWSLGVVIYYLAMAKYPFAGDNPLAISLNVAKGTYDPLPKDNNNNNNSVKYFSADFVSLVDHCLDVNPDTRYDIFNVQLGIVNALLERINVLQRLNLEEDSINISEKLKRVEEENDRLKKQNEKIENEDKTLREKLNKTKSKLDELLLNNAKNVEGTTTGRLNLDEEISKLPVVLQEEVKKYSIEEQIGIFKLPSKEREEELGRIQSELTKPSLFTIKDLYTLRSVSKHGLRNTVITIYLRHIKLTEEDVSYLSNSVLPYCHKLTYLEFCDAGITDKGAKDIAAALPSLTTLTKLALHENKIGDEGAKSVADVLPSLTGLTELYLNDNNIGDEGVKAIANALPSLTFLTKLWLSLNINITQTGKKAVTEAVPSGRKGELKIKW